MTHHDKVGRLRGPGVEIGAFTNPIPGIQPIYVDRYREFGHQKCRADYQGEACALPFYDHSLGYVASSHVLEHVANPVAALMEWYRVTTPGGHIYCVVPDRRFTWDRERRPTPVEHFFDDYARGTTPVDSTHISDFIDGIVWSEFYPHLAPAELAVEKEKMRASMTGAVAAGQEINIHFHVFEPDNLRGLLEDMRTHPATQCRWKLVDFAERFPDDCPNGILAVLEVEKRWPERLAALKPQIARGRYPGFPLLPTAVKW